VDTSALIDWLEETYPPASFPGIVQRVDDLVDSGRFILSEEVWKESQRVDQETKLWCAARKDAIMVPTDAEIAAEAANVLQRYPKLVDPRTNKGGADPFVVAVARLRTATVVTGERGGSPARPKIPYVCDELSAMSLAFLT
jgi:hypothetical protein